MWPQLRVTLYRGFYEQEISMTKENDQQTITRRGILGGLAASAALGIANELPSAAAAPLDVK
ncbi:MAG: hypothetical protein EA424_29525 [Planctomycetaceae bacterium]|nr:MAG: hypothetical protein EA424_29525 [Planctomycetaceae bacterium]